MLLVGQTEPKLDFSGAAVRFPCALEPIKKGKYAFDGHAAHEAAARAADLYDLGALLAWLLTGRSDRFEDKLAGVGLGAGSSLADLVHELLDDDPAERPSARRGPRAARRATRTRGRGGKLEDDR